VPDIKFFDTAECGNLLDIGVIETVTGIHAQAEFCGKLDGILDLDQLLLSDFQSRASAKLPVWIST
jgi:hypothetical protein